MKNSLCDIVNYDVKTNRIMVMKRISWLFDDRIFEDEVKTDFKGKSN